VSDLPSLWKKSFEILIGKGVEFGKHQGNYKHQRRVEHYRNFIERIFGQEVSSERYQCDKHQQNGVDPKHLSAHFIDLIKYKVMINPHGRKCNKRNKK
jgi:hypothetical protein